MDEKTPVKIDGHSSSIQTSAELQPLLSKDTKQSLRKYLLGGSGIVICLGFGAASTVLFWTPSLAYGENSDLGKYLSEKLGFNSGYLVFASGAAEFSALIMYGTAKSIPEFLAYIQQQPTVGAKLLRAGCIVVFSLAQGLQVPAVTLGAGGKLSLALIAGVGSFPNAFFASTNIVRAELPKIGRMFRKLYLNIQGCFGRSDFGYPYHQEKKLYELHDEFMRRLKAGQVELRRHNKHLTNLTTQNPEDWWLGVAEYIDNTHQESLCLRGSHAVARGGLQLGSIILGVGVLAMASILNMINNIMPKFFSNPIVSGFMGTLLSVAGVYLFFRLFTDTVGEIYNIVRSVLTSAPVNEMGFQLHPVLKPIIFSIGTIWSLLSFPTVLTLLKNSYHGSYQEELGYDISAAIIFFHIASVMHFFNICAQRFAESRPIGDPRKALVEEYKAVEHAAALSPIEVMGKIQQLPLGQQTKLLGSTGANKLSNAVLALKNHGLFKSRLLDHNILAPNIENGKGAKLAYGSSSES